MRSGWHAPAAGSNIKAHFYKDDKPLCSAMPQSYPFTRPTRPATIEDHVCSYCAKAQDPVTVCQCWSCTMKRGGALR